VSGSAVSTEPTQADVDRGWIAFELLLGRLLQQRTKARNSARYERWKAE